MAANSCGTLDALHSLALAAQTYKLVCPTMIEGKNIMIKDGRHLLQELVTQNFVPNDCQIDNLGQGHSVTAITGPNHSGKSIYLKQVAIITYLAHLGSYVPATSATIGIIDKILTRLPTPESSATNESSFATDLRQASQILYHQTPRSLLIVDEFGKGTNCDDGAGLMSAFLAYLQSLGSQAPRSILATHFHDVLTFQNIHSPELRLMHMQVVSTDSTDDLGCCLTYLFSLKPGPCTSSFGIYCALVNGMPSTVIGRTQAILDQLSTNRPASILDLTITEEYKTRLTVAESAARKFLSINFDSVNSQTEEALLNFWGTLL